MSAGSAGSAGCGLFTFLSKVNMPHVHVHSQLYMQLITVNYARVYTYTCTSLHVHIRVSFRGGGGIHLPLARVLPPLGNLVAQKYFYGPLRAIPMIVFPRVRCMFIYIYILVSLTRVRVVYVVKEVTSFPGLSQLMGVVRNRTRSQALQSTDYRAAERKL